ncbi:MAG: hypothetical protein DA408_08365 [Bacteroidetes bacterium]|nr:MAG: hypothetical protein DA408_08365 [Bacteroidota bacterium]
MEQEALHDQIEAYLAGRLSDQERALFEQQLADQPELAAEVALHRGLARLLSDGEKLAFRQSLAAIAQSLPSPGAQATWKKLRLLGWSALVLLILAVLGWWQFRPAAVVKPSIRQAPTLPATDTAAELPPSLPPAPQELPVPPAAPVPVPAPVKKPSPQAFAPNPALEAEMATAGDPYYTIQDTHLEVVATGKAAKFRLTFQALLLTALEPPVLVWSIRSNKPPAGEEKMSITIQPELLEIESNVRAFALKKAYRLAVDTVATLSPGLYYVRLQVPGQEKPLWMQPYQVVE